MVPCSIFTESEAAGRYCRLLPLRTTSQGPFYMQRPGTSHLIVNLGGMYSIRMMEGVHICHNDGIL